MSVSNHPLKQSSLGLVALGEAKSLREPVEYVNMYVICRRALAASLRAFAFFKRCRFDYKNGNDFCYPLYVNIKQPRPFSAQSLMYAIPRKLLGRWPGVKQQAATATAVATAADGTSNLLKLCGTLLCDGT